MTYNKTIWVDRVDNNPYDYEVDGVVKDIRKSNIGLTTPGTSVNAANMNNIEDQLETNTLDVEKIKNVNYYQSLEINKLRMELVLAQLNSIGYYDLFDTDSGINNSLTTATLDTTAQNVTFNGTTLYDVEVISSVTSSYNISVNSEVKVGDRIEDTNEVLNVEIQGNTWDETGATASERWNESVEYNGKIYVKGSDDSVWIYDIATDTWDETTGAAPSGSWSVPVEINGKLYVRGSDYKTIWIYDIATNTWDETTGTAPTNAWVYPAKYNDNLYAVTVNTLELYLYNTATNTWDEALTNPSGLTGVEYLITYNDKIYAKNKDDDTVIYYDINTDSWAYNLQAPSSDWRYPTIYNRKMYVKGVDDSVWIYDIATDTWDETTGTAPSGFWVYPVVYNGKIYARGSDYSSISIYDIEKYNLTLTAPITATSGDILSITPKEYPYTSLNMEPQQFKISAENCLVTLYSNSLDYAEDYEVYINNIMGSLTYVESNKLTYEVLNISSDTLELKIVGKNGAVLDKILVSVS